jgi:hypothetical protein
MSRKDKDIPSWQRSVFDKNSHVETKPITVKMIRQIEKDFYHNNKEVMKIKDPKLYEFYKKDLKVKKKTEPKPVKQIKESQVKSKKNILEENELDKHQKERKLQREREAEKIRQEQSKPLITFNSIGCHKDPNRGMRWVDCREPVNQGKLGSSQSWKYKKEKKFSYYW